MTARENAETADLTLEVRSLREQLAESEKKCLALTVESEGWARQLAEATGLLNGWCENFNVHWQPQALKDNSEAFLSRAPAQAAEPTPAERLIARNAELHCEKAAAESKLAAVYDWTLQHGKALVPHGEWTDSYGDGMRAAKRQVKALLAPSQGEGGGE